MEPTKYLKIEVGRHVWLVPVEIVFPDGRLAEFLRAVEKFNQTKDGEFLDLTGEEAEAFFQADQHPATWKPF